MSSVSALLLTVHLGSCSPPWLHLSPALLSLRGSCCSCPEHPAHSSAQSLGKDPEPGCQQKEELQSHSWKCQTVQTQEISLTRNTLPGDVEIPE